MHESPIFFLPDHLVLLSVVSAPPFWQRLHVSALREIGCLYPADDLDSGLISIGFRGDYEVGVNFSVAELCEELGGETPLPAKVTVPALCWLWEVLPIMQGANSSPCAYISEKMYARLFQEDGRVFLLWQRHQKTLEELRQQFLDHKVSSRAEYVARVRKVPAGANLAGVMRRHLQWKVEQHYDQLLAAGLVALAASLLLWQGSYWYESRVLFEREQVGFALMAEALTGQKKEPLQTLATIEQALESYPPKQYDFGTLLQNLAEFSDFPMAQRIAYQNAVGEIVVASERVHDELLDEIQEKTGLIWRFEADTLPRSTVIRSGGVR
ncbi:hypothetical protein [Chrysiogenes arsenatis]|uniref:hypothetical protein n=1 Tax=Chrysiogenes arsenatis TaxID=309797 RepID=UPI00040613C5|nr:hypothetical protein [Chrysiogenes arsenatis]